MEIKNGIKTFYAKTRKDWRKWLIKNQIAEKRRDEFLRTLTEKRIQQKLVKDERKAKAQLKVDNSKKMNDQKVSEIEKRM